MKTSKFAFEIIWPLAQRYFPSPFWLNGVCDGAFYLLEWGFSNDYNKTYIITKILLCWQDEVGRWFKKSP